MQSFAVNFDFINDNNSTFLKLEYVLKMYCQVKVEYYAPEIFIVESSLSVKIRKRSYPDIFCVNSFLCFDVKNLLLNFLQSFEKRSYN